MEASLSALFEFQIEKVQQVMRAESEKKSSKMEKEIEYLRSVVTELKSDSSQLKLDNTQLTSTMTAPPR